MNFNPIVFALRHPITIMVGITALVVGSALAVLRMKIDIFPQLNLPVIFLVLRGETKSIGEFQDQALLKVGPMFSSLPGVSAPPPFGGNQRTIVVRADPERFRAYHLSPDEVVAAIAKGNQITPSGNITIQGMSPMVPVNSVVGA